MTGTLHAAADAVAAEGAAAARRRVLADIEREFTRGLHAPALAQASALLAEAPFDPYVLRRVGRLQMFAGDRPAGLRLIQLAARLAPDDPDADWHVGAALGLAGEHAEALPYIERAIAREPRSRTRQVFRARALLATGRHAEGRAALAAATELPPVSADQGGGSGTFNVAMARLALGDWRAGWRDLEARRTHFPDVGFAARVQPRREWRAGEPWPDAPLWVYPEGGLGDVMLFARYLPPLAAAHAARTGREVVAVCEAPAHRLVAASCPTVRVVGWEAEPPPEAVGVGQWSLPERLGLAAPGEAPAAPYLHPLPDAPTLPPRAADRPLRAGLVWAGGLHYDTHDRSIPTRELLAPLLAVAGVEWWSLQIGQREDWADDTPLRRPPRPRDLADTAGLLAQLDVVVTVDTAVANLAGALARPTWVLPPTIPEFRWMLGAPRTPWYPATVVFRRREVREWAGALGRVAAALAEYAATGTSPADRTIADRHAELPAA